MALTDAAMVPADASDADLELYVQALTDGVDADDSAADVAPLGPVG